MYSDALYNDFFLLKKGLVESKAQDTEVFIKYTKIEKTEIKLDEDEKEGYCKRIWQ